MHILDQTFPLCYKQRFLYTFGTLDPGHAPFLGRGIIKTLLVPASCWIDTLNRRADGPAKSLMQQHFRFQDKFGICAKINDATF